MKKIIVSILLIGIIVIGAVGYQYYQSIMTPNTAFEAKSKVFKVPSGSSYEQLVKILEEEQILNDISSFKQTAELMKYKETSIKSGQFEIESGKNNKEIIQLLRSGKQKPVKLSFNNIRTLNDLAGKFAPYIEPDSLSLLNCFTDQKNLDQYQTDLDNIMSKFIPNTYEVYWNITPNDLLTKMNSESKKFWDKKNRLALLDTLGYTKEQVYTLASIVEKETQNKAERNRIAGVYLNRLKRGIPLQADPTVVFALKQFDLKRVLLKHLEIDSPFNTYKNGGLPPGPIYMPSISSIDAVLNAEKHAYLYFCAKPGWTGTHAFAKSLVGHNVNARNYQRWLSKNRIM